MRRSSRKGDDFTEAGTHCETTGRHEEQHQYLPPLIDTEGTRTFVACYDSKVTNFTSTKSQKSLRLAHGPWRYIDAPPESVCDLAILATHKAATAGILLLWVAILN